MQRALKKNFFIISFGFRIKNSVAGLIISLNKKLQQKNVLPFFYILPLYFCSHEIFFTIPDTRCNIVFIGM